MGIISGTNEGYFQGDYSRAVSKETGKARKKSKNREAQRARLPMATKVIDNIIYPVQTKRGLKWGKPKQAEPRLQTVTEGSIQTGTQPSGKLLDGFLILYSCRVRLPHEAIKSKLSSQHIVDVIEEDLCYFQNLTSLDVSDNRIKLEQLRNLKYLNECNL